MSETPAALITALIVERPMCIDCIAKRVDLSVTATETAITMIQAALDVHRERARLCRACGTMGEVFYLSR